MSINVETRWKNPQTGPQRKVTQKTKKQNATNDANNFQLLHMIDSNLMAR